MLEMRFSGQLQWQDLHRSLPSEAGSCRQICHSFFAIWGGSEGHCRRIRFTRWTLAVLGLGQCAAFLVYMLQNVDFSQPKPGSFQGFGFRLEFYRALFHAACSAIVDNFVREVHQA